MRREMLVRNRIPGPSLSMAPQTEARPGFTVTVRPAMAEEQPWNLWPDGTARLFNDTVGYLWLVDVEADVPVTWIPAASRLAVNDSEQIFRPAAGPDEVLVHLLTAARLEAALGSSGDLDLRVRAAEGFRRAYLATAPLAGPTHAVVVFPAPATRIHAIAMALELAFETPSGVARMSWLFE